MTCCNELLQYWHCNHVRADHLYGQYPVCQHLPPAEAVPAVLAPLAPPMTAVVGAGLAALPTAAVLGAGTVVVVTALGPAAFGAGLATLGAGLVAVLTAPVFTPPLLVLPAGAVGVVKFSGGVVKFPPTSSGTGLAPAGKSGTM